MALIVNEVVNNTDAELVVVDKAQKTVEPISPHSAKSLTYENLYDLTFVSKTARPIYIRIRSVTGDVGNGGDQVIVETGDSEEEEDT